MQFKLTVRMFFEGRVAARCLIGACCAQEGAARRGVTIGRVFQPIRRGPSMKFVVAWLASARLTP